MLSGSKWAKKIPSSLRHSHQPEPLIQGRWIHSFMFTPNSDPILSRLVRPGTVFTIFLCPPEPHFPVISWQEGPVWSSAAAARFLPHSTCCMFRDAILHYLVVTSGYLSDCFLPVTWNQFAHSALTCHINTAFSFTYPPNWIFPLIVLRGLWVKISVDQ